MNDFKIVESVIDVSADDISSDLKSLTDYKSSPTNLSNLTMHNSSNIEIVSGMIRFDGTNNDGLLWNNVNQAKQTITTSRKSYYISFDFYIESSTSLQSLFVCMNNSTTLMIPFGLYYDMSKSLVMIICYTTANTGYGIWSGFYKLVVGVTYTFKLLVLSNNEFGMYINNTMICRGNMTRKTDRATGGTPQVQVNSTGSYFFGMQAINSTTYNFKGRMNNIKLYNIASDDTIVYTNTLYEKNKIFYIPFDYVLINVSYNDESIKNFGTNNNAISFRSAYESQFATALGGAYMSWFKTHASYPLFFDTSYLLNLDSYSLSLRIKTGATLSTCSLIDTRSSVSLYDGFLLSMNSSDPSMLSLSLSARNYIYSNTTSWYETINTSTNIIKVNSEHLVSIICTMGAFKIYVDGILVASAINTYIKPNYIATVAFFGDSVGKTSTFNGHVRDISIYNSDIKPQDDVSTYDMMPSGEYVTKIAIDNKYGVNLNINNPVTLSLLNQDATLCMYGSNSYRSLYYYIEGSETNGNEILLYDGDTLIYQSYDTMQYNFISNGTLNNYRLYHSGRNQPIVFLSQQRGYIDGNVTTANCGATNFNFVIRCYDSLDHRYVGEFPVINGGYNLANLDATRKYNIILVDTDKLVEQKILSDRTPTPY